MFATQKMSLAVLAALVLAGPALAETNAIAAAVALSPDRCALDVAMPSEGVVNPSGVGAEKDCVDRVDAVPMMMTSAGPVPMVSAASGSASEDALLLSLGERQQSLDSQQASLAQQALLLDAAEKLIAERTAKLTELEASINQLVDVRDQQSQQQIDEMVSLYQSMKPRDAAAVMGGLPDDVLVKIASSIPPRKMSAILAEMSTSRAQALTVMLIDRTATAQP